MLGFDALISREYNQERRRFFERWSSIATGLSIAAGTGMAASLQKQAGDYALWGAVALTLLQTVNLVVGFSRKAWFYADEYRKWVDLFGEWETTEPSPEALNRLRGRRKEIERGEPPSMPYLVTKCQIDVERRLGYPPARRAKLHPLKRLLCQYLPDLGHHD